MPYKDPAQQRKFQRERLAQRRADFFKDKACTRCGSTERLELDHKDPAQKVTHRIWSWSQERMAVELAKCQVLCHKCHLVKTTQEDERPRATCGTHNAYASGCHCAACRRAHSLYNHGKVSAAELVV